MPISLTVVLGPGAGKGTQCAKLASEFGMRHLSAGELLRQEMTTPGSEHGSLIDSYLKEGKIVPVKITLDLLKRQMSTSNNHNNRYLIDGFPRNWDNVVGWEEYMPEVCEMEQVLVIDCLEEELEKRLLSRGKTSGRSDDNIESARKRFHTFREATLPVIEYYEKAKKVSRINGNQDMDHVYNDIKLAVEPLIEHEILHLTEHLLDAISSGNTQLYAQLVDPSITALEPEGQHKIIHGIEFHQQLLQRPSVINITRKSSIREHHVRVLGKVAIIAYIRDIRGSDGSLSSYEETRVWNLVHGDWMNVHFHRS
jgi:UMP-CMP kinase